MMVDLANDYSPFDSNLHPIKMSNCQSVETLRKEIQRAQMTVGQKPGASGGNGIPAVAIVNMQGSKSNACVSTDGSSYTINAMHGHDVHAVAFQQNTRDEVRLMNGDGQIAGALASESGMKQQNYLASTTMQVRRLTPTECERLQGFPDGWTAIPWKKKLADDCPDGPRYKALGNSMAVNCMEWIGQRINAIQTQS